MTQAWQNNDKYIVVFDAPGANNISTTQYGILTTADLNDMKNFWNYAHNHQPSKNRPSANRFRTSHGLRLWIPQSKRHYMGFVALGCPFANNMERYKHPVGNLRHET